MRFDLTIPDPSTMRVGKEAYVVLDKGTELHRIHPAVYKAEQFNPTNAGDARFSPIHDTSGAIIPTIYAAQTFDCATCEIILRCEPHRVRRRPFGLSYAAKAGSSSMA